MVCAVMKSCICPSNDGVVMVSLIAVEIGVLFSDVLAQRVLWLVDSL